MSHVEIDLREFARTFPTPNVERLIALCEAGRISWEDGQIVAKRALADGIGAVA